jgi:long-chain acyl-CoA synthetase
MIVSENSIPLACLLLAASRLDVWAIVANPRLTPRELDQIRDHSGVRRMFFTAQVSEEAAAHAARCDAPAQDVGPLYGIGVSALNRATQPEPVKADGASQVAVLIYTSGTTGMPKGVMLTHRNLLFSAKTTANLRNMTAADVQYCVLPISHIVGISLLTMTLMVGAVTRLVSRYNPAALAKALAEEGITLLNGVPATYQRLLEYKQMTGLPKLERGALRLMSAAGAPLDLELKARVEKELGLPLSNAFGITECSPGISSVRPDAPRDDNSVGTLVPGIEARIVGRDGAVMANGEIGELHVRGPNVMHGYYRAPDLTARAIDPDGWFNTGDLARFDGDALFIVGRTKEMIIRSGFNVYPAEIEAVLSTHPAVVQCAVVGRPVEGNEEVVAFVQLLKGSKATAQDLVAHVAPQLTSYKRPSEIVLLDALPATSTGKILKHKLAESLREG